MKRIIIFLVVAIFASVAGFAVNITSTEQTDTTGGGGSILAAAFVSAVVAASAASDRIEEPQPQVKSDENITFAK